MQRLQRVVGNRVASRTLRQPVRMQSTSRIPDGVVSVRAKSYGPSRNLVRGVRPNQQVVVETRMHPSDVEVQRSVLALTVPSLTDVAVVNAPDHRSYASSTPQCSPLATAASSEVPRTDSTDVALRMELLENSLEGQLAGMANLIIQQVERATGARLTELEVRQNGEVHDLASTIVRSIRSELRRSAAVTTVDPKTGAASVNVEEVTCRVSEQVVKAMHKQASKTVARVDSLERKVDAYFSQLEKTMTAAVGAGAPSATTSSSAAAEELRTALVNSVTQAAQVQRESLMAVLEDFLADGSAEGKCGSKNNNGGGGGAVDTRALEEFIEGSLRVATEDIRHAVAAELKKATRSGKSSGSKGGDAMDTDAVEEIVDRLDAAAIAAKRTLSTVEVVEEGLSAVQEEQRHTKELLLSIKSLLEQQQQSILSRSSDSKQVSVAAAAATAAAEGQPDQLSEGGLLLAAVAELQQSVLTMAAAMDVGNEILDRQLMGMAQAISESVLTAVESRTSETLSSAVAAVESCVRNMTTIQDQLVHDRSGATVTSNTANTSSTAHDADAATDATIAPGATVDPVALRADIAAAVEAVLVPKLEAAFERAQQAAVPQPEHQVALAQSVSDAVIAAVTASGATTPAPAATGNNIGASGEDVLAKLDALRVDLVATVEREMGKTHEVNLIPMYKYVDSMLTFLKEELSAQESNLDRKIGEATAQLSVLITTAQGSRAEAEDKVSRAVSGEDLQTLVSKVETTVATATQTAIKDMTEAATAAITAMTAAAAEEKEKAKSGNSAEEAVAAVANESIVNALKLTALESASEKMMSQLDAIQAALRSATGEQQVFMKARLDSLLARDESQARDITASLSKLEASLAAQTAAVEALSPAARMKHVAAVAVAVDRVAQLHELRTSTTQRLTSITSLIERIESTMSTSERKLLVQELQADFTTLAELRAREEACVGELTSPDGIVETAEAAAATATVRSELARFAADLESKVATASHAHADMEKELLTAVQAISSGLKSASEISEATARLVRDRTDALEKVVASQQNASTERLAREIANSTATMLKELSSTQLSSAVGKIAEQSERQILSKVSEGFADQMTAMQTLVSTLVTRSGEVATSQAHVERIAVAAARHMGQAMTTEEAKRRTDGGPVAVPVARVPLWWLIANPLLLCLAVLSCAYYLFACFLIAFVPVPGPTPSGSDESSVPPTSSSSSHSGSESAPQQDADWASYSAPHHGRRVVDRVL